MEIYYIKPDITRYAGIEVKKDTKLKFENEEKTILQKLENLILTTELINKTDDFETKSIVRNFLTEGDILIYSDMKGYQVPGVPVATAKEIKEDFEALI